MPYILYKERLERENDISVRDIYLFFFFQIFYELAKKQNVQKLHTAAINFTIF